MAKSIIRRSCINWTGSTLFCPSIQDKHFLKHSAASELETCFSSWPSSSSSLLSFSLECPVTVAKICSSDICSVVGSSLSRLSHSSRSWAFSESFTNLLDMLKHFNHWLGRMLFFRLWVWLAVVRVDFKFVVSLADGFWACFIPSVANHVKCIFHSVKLYNVLNALCVIEILSANNFLEKLSLVSILHRLQDSLIHRLNERGSVRRKKHACYWTITAAEFIGMCRTIVYQQQSFRGMDVLQTLMAFNCWHEFFRKPLGKNLRIHPGISLRLVGLQASATFASILRLSRCCRWISGSCPCSCVYQKSVACWYQIQALNLFLFLLYLNVK